jgi:hypothetical protein
MHIFNVSIINVQCLKNVSQDVRGELIPQSRYHQFKTCWKNTPSSTTCKFFSRNVRTLPKNHMHISYVSIITCKLRFDKIILNSFFEMSFKLELNTKCDESYDIVYAKVFFSKQDIQSCVINEHTGPNQILSDQKT